MQFLEMAKDMTLSTLASIVGTRNVDTVLNANSLERAVNIGAEFLTRPITNTIVDAQKKMSILNQFVGDSDIFEKAALGSELVWQSLAQFNCFPDAIRIPEEIKIPSSVGVLGNGEPVSNGLYAGCMDDLKYTGEIQTTRFAEYSDAFPGGALTGGNSTSEPFQWFKLPWGEVALYSTLSPDEMLYFPVYPETLDDGVTANYDEMGEMLYQYEPWKVYKSSGPRTISFNFSFHRDMWTGDHRDGCANNLIRGCEANCYPNFDGSLVNVPIVSLYIHGTNFITGVMTDCKTKWDGPIGLDGYYLKCELSFTIIEISPQALSYNTIRGKGLIG